MGYSYGRNGSGRMALACDACDNVGGVRKEGGRLVATGLTARLKAKGFDRSHPVPFESGVVVGCSQCEAVAICGVACHECGCPNETFECKGCNASVTRRGAYCEDCS